jgi:hypothetical protein
MLVSAPRAVLENFAYVYFALHEWHAYLEIAERPCVRSPERADLHLSLASGYVHAEAAKTLEPSTAQPEDLPNALTRSICPFLAPVAAHACPTDALSLPWHALLAPCRSQHGAEGQNHFSE